MAAHGYSSKGGGHGTPGRERERYHRHVAPEVIVAEWLIVDVVAAQMQRISHVRLSDLSDGVFLAEVVLANGARISARPSDAVPVALAGGAPIRSVAAVLDAAAVPIEHIAEGAFDDLYPPPGTQFRRYIEQRAKQLRRWPDSATVRDVDSDPGPDAIDPGPSDSDQLGAAGGDHVQDRPRCGSRVPTLRSRVCRS